MVTLRSLFGPIGSMLGQFRRDRRGVLPVVFAIAIVPTLALIGISVDYAGARRVQVSLQSALDAAVLDAVTQSEKIEVAAGNTNNFARTDSGYEPIKRARDLFNSMASAVTGVQNVTLTLEVSREKNVFRAKGSYAGNYITKMPGVVNASTMALTGYSQSTVSISGSGYLDIYALLDTSSSMGIGASQVDIDNLKKYLGCAFSCHGEKPTQVPVQLRVDVMRDAVLDMIASAKAEHDKQEDGEAARIRIALNKFDHQASSIKPLSSDYASLKTAAQGIKLHPTDHRGTNAKAALDWILPNVPQSGNGMTPESPRRFVFLVTDGLQDRYPVWYPTNFPGPTGANGRTGPIDPQACQALKNKGITVAVLYTTHIGIKDYEWYWQSPQPQVKPNLQACASTGFFFEGSNAAQLSAEFKKMFIKAVQASTPRLER